MTNSHNIDRRAFQASLGTSALTGKHGQYARCFVADVWNEEKRRMLILLRRRRRSGYLEFQDRHRDRCAEADEWQLRSRPRCYQVLARFVRTRARTRARNRLSLRQVNDGSIRFDRGTFRISERREAGVVPGACTCVCARVHSNVRAGWIGVRRDGWGNARGQRGGGNRARERERERESKGRGTQERETGRERLPENYKLYVVPNRPSKIIPAHPAAIMNM